MLWRMLAALRRAPLAPPALPDAGMTAALAERLQAAGQERLGCSLAIRFVEAGGCNGCMLEARMLTSLVYDLERFGLTFVDSPRHADVLLVTGPVTRNMQEAVRLAYAAMPDPKWVVALGDCAIDAGVFKGGYGVLGGVEAAVPVDLTIRGCPPTPAQILDGLRALVTANATP